MKYKTQSKAEDLALHKVLECTVSHTGEEFFRALVKNLAEVLGTKGAMVTEFIPSKKKGRALAYWIGNDFVDGYEYDIAGTPCEKVFEKRKLYHVPQNLLRIFPEDSDLSSFSAASYLGMPLFDLDGTILGNLAVLDTKPMPEVARNVTLFKIFADRAASELRRLRAEKQLHERSLELQREYSRKSAELENARKMQLNMLPKSVPFKSEYQFSFSMKTASEVGGDYYDYSVSDDGTLTFGIGDATGHGLQASVMVTAMKLLFSEHAANTDILEFLRRASRSISLMDFRKIYMAFAIGRLKDNTLEFAGAGMPPALICRDKSKTLEKIDLKGLPLGSRTIYPYTRSITHLHPGDTVILMSDGLPELFNADGEMLGYKRISELILQVCDQSPEAIIDHLQNASEEWLQDSLQDDDMTLFIFKRNPVFETNKMSGRGTPEVDLEADVKVIPAGG